MQRNFDKYLTPEGNIKVCRVCKVWLTNDNVDGYCQNHPNGRCAATARGQICELQWDHPGPCQAGNLRWTNSVSGKQIFY